MITVVKVLGKPYQVIEKAVGCGGSRAFGEADHSALTIEIAAEQADAQKRDTLLHEVIHCIEFALHLEFEERQVHALASGLLCVLRDNPELVAYLTEST